MTKHLNVWQNSEQLPAECVIPSYRRSCLATLLLLESLTIRSSVTQELEMQVP